MEALIILSLAVVTAYFLSFALTPLMLWVFRCIHRSTAPVEAACVNVEGNTLIFRPASSSRTTSGFGVSVVAATAIIICTLQAQPTADKTSFFAEYPHG